MVLSMGYVSDSPSVALLASTRLLLDSLLPCCSALQVQLGMVEVLQRMKQEVVQWQVRAQGAARQNSVLVQQVLETQVSQLP